MNEESTVTIRLGPELMTLYHVGYVAEDIAKVIVLAHFPTPEELGVVGGVRSSDPFEMWRYDARLRSNLELLRVRVREGSIELVLVGATLLASIIVPLVVLHAQKLAASKVTLEVRSSHPLLSPLLTRYKAGEFGFGREGLFEFFRNLARLGIDIEAVAPNVFVLTSIIERYSTRLSRITEVSLPR